MIAKANDDGRVPVELRDPFYRDQNGREMLKPWITQRMANAELYGRALANIYGVPDYSCLSHHNILQLLNKRGVSVEMIAGSDICEPITETLLLKNSPVQLVWIFFCYLKAIRIYLITSHFRVLTWSSLNA